MKKITVKNLNQLSYKDQKLKGNLGLWAEANKNGTISFRIMKRIKRVSNKSYKSPFRGTLGHYPEMSIKEAEIEAKRIIAICNKGLHPRKSEPKIDKWTPDKNLQRKLLIVGTGGHSNSVASVAKSSGYKISAFVDKSKTKKKIKFISDKEAIKNFNKEFFAIAIGDNFKRETIYNYYRKKISFSSFPALIHKSAVISDNVKISGGTVIMPNVTIGPNTKIGMFCILNTNCSVDHDCNIKSFCSLAPGSILGGNVKVGCRSAIGLGAIIKNGIKIGNDTVIGSASYVHNNIGNNLVCFGIPAKKVGKRKNYEIYLK